MEGKPTSFEVARDCHQVKVGGRSKWITHDVRLQEETICTMLVSGKKTNIIDIKQLPEVAIANRFQKEWSKDKTGRSLKIKGFPR